LRPTKALLPPNLLSLLLPRKRKKSRPSQRLRNPQLQFLPLLRVVNSQLSNQLQVAKLKRRQTMRISKKELRR
jgi:hypothetical protein